MSEKAITKDDLDKLENEVKELKKIVTDHNGLMFKQSAAIKVNREAIQAILDVIENLHND